MLKDLKNPFVLAPLAGVTDSAFRRVCFQQGAALAFTEMVSAKGLYYRNANTEELLKIREDEGPVGIQLFGSEPLMLQFAAECLVLRLILMPLRQFTVQQEWFWKAVSIRLY